jgi:hypothetical protein
MHILSPSGPKPASKLGSSVKPMAGGLANAETPLLLLNRKTEIKKETAHPPRIGASLVGTTKSRSPPKAAAVTSDTEAPIGNHKKTFSLVSYSSEDSDSDADQ